MVIEQILAVLRHVALHANPLPNLPVHSNILKIQSQLSIYAEVTRVKNRKTSDSKVLFLKPMPTET